MKSRLLRSLRAAAFFAPLLAASVALADAPPPAPLSQTLTGTAKSLYEAGKLLFQDRDYAGAGTKYRAAYDASHDARLLWNMAACEKELRHYARASLLVDRFLKEAGGALTPDVLAQARATQTALREFFSPVQLSVHPDGALVFVDGDEIGRTPFAAPVPIDLGTHVVRVEKDGFSPYEQRLEVVGQNPLSIEATLKAIDTTAFLSIHPSETGDSIAVDDKMVATGTWDGPLAPGKHHVQVTATGKRAYATEIELAVGEHRSLEMTLESAKKAPIWPWIVAGGVVVVAGGAVGGYFLFKPSDTEGPPPAGKLGTVEIDAVRGRGRR
jgi:hypothetical protein